MTRMTIAFLALAALVASPAEALVKDASESGFTVSFVHRVKARPDAVWAALVMPSRWWSKDHSWSGDAKNLSIEPRAGGCFCERWGQNSVEHARIVFVKKGEQLRMLGAFGPLQSESLAGVLTVTLTPQGDETEIGFDYVVGGHARFSLKEIAPIVDGVIGAQAKNLAGLFSAVN